MSFSQGAMERRLLIVLFLPQILADTVKVLNYKVIDETPEGHFIGSIVPDANLHSSYTPQILANLNFKILGKPKTDIVRIDEAGVVETSQRVDRENFCARIKNCTIIIDIAVSSPQTDVIIVKVQIVVDDINDSTPRWDTSHLNKELRESADINATLSINPAIDDDSPANRFGVVTYSIQKGRDLFDLRQPIGSGDVKLLLKRKLDREDTEVHRIILRATDGGGKSSDLQILLRVLDSNDNSPVFTKLSYTVTVKENDLRIEPLLTVSAVDKDQGDNGHVIYDFSPRTKQQYSNIFSLGRETGEIHAKQALDYETRNYYQLDITARDKGADSQTVQATVYIKVSDENDHSPEIIVNTLTEEDTTKAYVLENIAMESFIAFITVTDADTGEGGKFKCLLIDSSRTFAMTSFSEGRYKLVTKLNIDRESRDFYVVSIQCSDMGTPKKTSEKNLEIIIMDENDLSPVFRQTVYKQTIGENNIIGKYITTVNATDKDDRTNGEVRYRFPDKAIYQHLTINSIKGTIQAAESFDREKLPFLETQVEAYDLGKKSNSAFATLQLTILDENDNSPSFLSDFYNFKVQEEEQSGTLAGQVEAVDPDSDDFNDFTYSLRGTDFFRIEADSGRILTTTRLDREDKKSHRFIAVATDIRNTLLSSEIEVTVDIEDINDNPPQITFPKSENASISISSFTPVGKVIGTVIAWDLDERDSLTYHLETASEYFVMESMSGRIRVSKDLTAIANRVIRLDFQVKDGGLIEEHATPAFLNIFINSSLPWKETKKKSDGNLTIVIGLACATAFIAVALLAAIFALKRQEKRDDKRCKDLPMVRCGSIKALTTAVTYENNQNSLQSTPSKSFSEVCTYAGVFVYVCT
ncbi:unnamed protein product [Dimorphilus gyrociliatus]|uniref:Cadherin domain-containing protein n=1 Tax=Dimorphilus gyrociliatus TaxID=2664684 RepID=A0A7I8VCU5_9ANNE|nr:unnamed protein product [Dimorphilus gyrociliatus]